MVMRMNWFVSHAITVEHYLHQHVELKNPTLHILSCGIQKLGDKWELLRDMS